jgi:hypothetical protein
VWVDHREAVLDRQLRNYDQILNYESMMAFLIKGAFVSVLRTCFG